ERRIADLAGREQVAVQHELLAASFIDVAPDPTEAVRETELDLPEQLYDRVIGLLRPTSTDELASLRASVIERSEKLAKLSEVRRFDSSVGTEVGRRLATALADTSSLNETQRALL